jgi:outer membrane biogenesis lipoprotein LolB
MLSACQTPMPRHPLGSDVLIPSHLRSSSQPQGAHLEGRLLIEIGSSPAQRISSSFELDTDGASGELRLLGPLGTTSALITWNPAQAQLQSSELNPPLRHYPSLSMLMKQWLGTELPLQAILLWLQGQDERIPGWQLLDSGNNTKVAVRASAQGPEPSVSIKLMLNEASP